MPSRDYRDLLGGLILIGIGLFAAIYASSSYSLGTLRQMGPGMVPMLLGYVMIGLGSLILIPALFKAGPAEPVTVEWRPLVMVSLSIAAFALTVERLGLLPAILLLTVGSAFAGSKLGLVMAVILGLALSALATLIFVVGFSIPLRIVRWNW